MKIFGALLQYLRELKKKYNPDTRSSRSWTQQDLAQKAGLSVHQIGKIEQGRYKNVAELLPLLADALELSRPMRKQFYAAAGFLYHDPPRYPDLPSIQAVVEKIHYPASVRTPLGDFLFMNSLHRELFNVDDAMVDKLQTDERGANLLWLLFDPCFRANNPKNTDTNAYIEAIWAFRIASFPFQTSQRYQFLIQQLMKLTKFELDWHDADGFSPEAIDENKQHRNRTHTFIHPKYGSMSYMSLRWPDKYFDDLTLAVYVPVYENEAKFAEMRKNAQNGFVTTFPYRNFYPELGKSDDAI